MSSLKLFQGRVLDRESNQRVLDLANSPESWTAAHKYFDIIRCRYLAAGDDNPRASQYAFEESCLQAMYNATEPPDPFDASSAFFVVPAALGLAKRVGLPVEAVASAFARR